MANYKAGSRHRMYILLEPVGKKGVQVKAYICQLVQKLPGDPKFLAKLYAGALEREIERAQRKARTSEMLSEICERGERG